MDPSMSKFLEEDEDDADVDIGDVDVTGVDISDLDAYIAFLNRDIQESCIMRGANQQPLAVGINDKQPMTSEMSNQPVFRTELSSQQAMHMGGANQQAMNLSNRGKRVPLSLLLPVIQSLLVGDKSRSMQLQTAWQTFQNNEIRKDAFTLQMRTIVGDQMINKAGYKFQRQATRDAAAQQHVQEPSTVPPGSSDFTLDNNVLQQYEVIHQGDSYNMQATQMSSSNFNASSHIREHPLYPVQRFNLQQQQHLHFSQTSCNTFGSRASNYHPFPTSDVTTSKASLKQAHDPQMGQLPVHHNVTGPQLGFPSQAVHMTNATKVKRQKNSGELKRTKRRTVSHMENNSALVQNADQWRMGNSKEQRNFVPLSMTYAESEVGDQSNDHQQRSHLSASQGLFSVPTLHAESENANLGNLKYDALEMQSSKVGCLASTSQKDYNLPVPSSPSPRKKTLVRKKKPLKALGSSASPSSKKRKVSGGAFSDQLTYFTAVTVVDLMEEEERLLSVPKEDGQVSETSRRVMQEEENTLILQKIPLQKKLAQIMAKSGLKSIGSDVEKCLSLCFEGRIRGLMSNLIKLSKQKVDVENSRHRTFITTDVQEKIKAINQKVRVECEKKQTEEEKLERLIEPEGHTAVDGDKEKDESRARPVKVVANKEEDEKMLTTAANVAALAAVGGHDVSAKWQLLAEQSRQKIEGGTDGSSGLQAGNDVSSITGSRRKLGRNQVIMAHNRVACPISVKDLIAVLEREAQMSRSPLMYRLYDKIHSE